MDHRCSVTLRSYSSNHIDVQITEDSDGKSWQRTGFYGVPQEYSRHKTWHLLRQLNNCPDMPWLVMGDFNKILFSFKK